MEQLASCPQCGASAASRLNFTWWGGALGPRLLNHVKCGNCAHKYNGKTGGSNAGGILVYSLIAGVLAFVVMFVAFFVLARLGS